MRLSKSDVIQVLVVAGWVVWAGTMAVLALQLRDQATLPNTPAEQAELDQLYGVMVHDSLSILNAVRGVSRELDHLCIELSGFACLGGVIGGMDEGEDEEET